MDLLALADFNLVARYGGFGKAAVAAHRPKATLSRRVAELEANLGVRLFERGSRNLKLTEEGRALHERTSALLTEIEEATTSVSSGGQAARGRLRISVPLLFSQTAMGRLAAGFVGRFPSVNLEVTTDDRAVDMIEEGYDLVIRVNPPTDETLVGRAFLRDQLVIVAGPAIARDDHGGAVPVIVRGNADRGSTWRMLSGEGAHDFAVETAVSLASMTMVRDAARANVGAARLPLSLVSGDIAAGRLVLWGDVPDEAIAIWALYPSRRLLSPRVSAFLGYLKEVFPHGTADELARYSA